MARSVASRCTDYAVQTQRFVQLAVKDFGVQDIFLKRLIFGSVLYLAYYLPSLDLFQKSRRWTGANFPYAPPPMPAPMRSKC
jgi:hypothetical protein